LLVGQSGGPTAVINATLAGAITEAQPVLEGKIYGLQGGLEGLIGGNDPLDLTNLTPAQLERLAQTGAGALGSGRMKPTEEDLQQALSYLKRYDIRYFVFIGGNGSQHTPLAMEQVAREQGYELYCVGAPKTIDNDVAGTDHTPGYGSAARWLAHNTLDTGLDLYTMRGFDHVKVIEAMGRHVGWLTAASVLARFRPDDPPHLILLPEVVFNEERFLAKVEEVFRQKGCVLVVASEGVKDAQGNFLAESSGTLVLDPVGKPMLSSGEGVATYLCRLVRDKLGLKARYDKPGTLQRTTTCVSPVDRAEAFELGQVAAWYALEGRSGVMPGLKRVSDEPYRCEIVAVPLTEVVGREKYVPAEFLEGDGLNEAAFRRYVAPLIGPPLAEPFRFV
jgi:6-phosphofructokinase 1